MEKIRTECSKCGRKLELPPEAAHRRKCGYCGGPLAFDAATEAVLTTAIASAVARAAADKLKIPIECPLCGRRAQMKGTDIGSEQKCAFCSCLYVVPSPGQPLILGPAGSRLDTTSVEAANKTTEAESDIEKRFAPLGGWLAHGEAVMLALRVLVRRYAVGHASPKEFGEISAVLFNELFRRAQANSQTPQEMPWMCSLPTDWSGDFVAYFICHAHKGELSLRPEGRHVVSIETGRHERTASGKDLSKETVGAFVATIALDIAIQVATEGEYGFEKKEDKEEKFFVREFLQVDLEPASGGSNFSFSHVWASGEKKELEEKHKNLIRDIRSGLHAKVLPFLCLKAVFGAWFGASAFQCLERERLAAWLKTLDPQLALSPAVDGLAAQGKSI